MNGEAIDDPAEFLARFGPWLSRSEARHTLILGLAGTLVDQPGLYPEYRMWAVEADDGPVAAALMTPPHNLVIADMDDRNAAEALIDAIEAAGVGIPGVAGNQPGIDHFVTAWCDRTGTAAEVTMEQGIFALRSLRPAPPVEGSWRHAGSADRGTVIRWWLEFYDEAHPTAPHDPDDIARQVDARLAHDNDGIALWEQHGEPVSMCSWSRSTAATVAIGMVYTPPELRRRGTASALVAAVSRERLDTGRTCVLYTDLANPTSNGIYRRLGYEQVAESRELRLSPDAG